MELYTKLPRYKKFIFLLIDNDVYITMYLFGAKRPKLKGIAYPLIDYLKANNDCDIFMVLSEKSVELTEDLFARHQIVFLPYNIDVLIHHVEKSLTK